MGITNYARASRALAAATIVAVSFLPAAAQRVDDVFPFEPEYGARVGPKPVLRVGVEGTDFLKMSFRIELSSDDFDTVQYTFDQLQDKNGWAYVLHGFDQPGALYQVMRPLDDGIYVWRASAWNGVSWIKGKSVQRLTVDSVPPEDVHGLEMTVDRETGGILLTWKPVTLDQNGRPEYVAKYHIYRYKFRSFFFVIRPFRIATVEQGFQFLDTDPVALNTPLIFYKVTAEDDSGNEPERRY